jgi:DNA repair exonuclease SbcCD nuclease subunit
LVVATLLGSAAWAQMPDLAPLPGTGKLHANSGSTQFTFVAGGDNRPAHKSCPQPATPGEIFSAVHQMNPSPALVFWTGDTISGKQPDKPNRIQKQYKEFLKIAKSGGVPVFNAPGNHELDDENNAPSDAMKKLYVENMSGTYGAFSYGNSRFIALNSEHQAATKVKSKSGKVDAPGAITKQALELLKQDLDANKDKAHVFIFMHHPVEPFDPEDGIDPKSVAALEDLFKKYTNVSYVISGHEHIYFNPQGGKTNPIAPPPVRTDPSQPPFYLVSGGAGAPLKKNNPGAFHHYLVITVDGNTVTPELKKLPTPAADPDDKCGG